MKGVVSTVKNGGLCCFGYCPLDMEHVIVLALHFSSTMVKVLIAAIAVARSGSEFSKCSKVSGTFTPRSDVQEDPEFNLFMADRN